MSSLFAHDGSGWVNSTCPCLHWRAFCFILRFFNESDSADQGILFLFFLSGPVSLGGLSEMPDTVRVSKLGSFCPAVPSKATAFFLAGLAKDQMRHWIVALGHFSSVSNASCRTELSTIHVTEIKAFLFALFCFLFFWSKLKAKM